MDESNVKVEDAAPNVLVGFLGHVIPSSTSVRRTDEGPASPQKRRRLYSRVIMPETPPFCGVYSEEHDEQGVNESLPFCRVFSSAQDMNKSSRFCEAYNSSIRRKKMMDQFGTVSIDMGVP